QAPLLDELDVVVAGEPHPRQNRAAARDLLGVEADPVGQPEPEAEPALTLLLAVVVADPVDPHPPEGRVVGLGDDDRVLDGDARLVVVAVEHPLLELLLRELALVHEHVVAVVIVVTAGALALEPLDEGVARQRRRVGRGHHRISLAGFYLNASQPSASAHGRGEGLWCRCPRPGPGPVRYR